MQYVGIALAIMFVGALMYIYFQNKKVLRLEDIIEIKEKENRIKLLEKDTEKFYEDVSESTDDYDAKLAEYNELRRKYDKDMQ